MDEATQQKLGELQAEENEKLAAFEDACAANADLHARTADDDAPSPSRNEKLAVKERVIAAEAELHAVRDRIRKIMWAEDGIVEGPPLTIGIDNVVQTIHDESWQQITSTGEGPS